MPFCPIRKYWALQSQNQAILGPYCSFLAIIHHCKNVAIFCKGLAKTLAWCKASFWPLSGLALESQQRYSLAICNAHVRFVRSFVHTQNRSCHALVGVLLRLWEYLDKSVYCANTIDLSLKKGGSTTCKTTRVQLSVKFRQEFRRRFSKVSLQESKCK